MNQRNDPLPDGSDPQLSGLYRAAPAENPPERLDAAIQAAARRAVGARPQAAGGSLLRAWRVPLSIAAVLVMSVSMVTLTVRHQGDQLTQPPLTAVAPALRSEAATAPAATVADSVAAAREAAPVPAAKPAAAGGSRENPAAPEPAETSAAATGTRPAQAFSPPGTAAAPTETENRMAEAKEERAATPSRSLAKVPPAAPPAAASIEAQAMRRDRAAAAAGGAADAAPTASALVRELETQLPEKWLEKILGLRQQGRMKEADELLIEFRKRHPNHPMPSPLR